MKLLFAIKHLGSQVGGAERVLCAICSELVVRGHEVTVLTFDRPGAQSFYPLDARIRRVDLGIGESAKSARLGETIQRIVALRQTVLEQRPELVVGFMHSIYVLLALALAGTGIPVVGSEHTVPTAYRTRPLQYLLLFLTSPLLTKMTVLSESIRMSFPALVRARMVVMSNPVIEALGQADHDTRKTRHILLNVGRLDTPKDHSTLLRAFALIATSHPTWELRITGEGRLRPDLEQLVHDLKLEGRVHMPGITSDIGAEYRAADIFVISSSYEAFGLVTAEAMSYGLPVVGFADCPGTNELVQNGQTGLLASGNPDRAQSLASEMDRLLSDSELRRRCR